MINDNGQAVGASAIVQLSIRLISTTSCRFMPCSGKKGKATDLGNLGGTTGQAGGNIALDINNQGQVVGNSDLPGDTTFHAFLWTKEKGMQDLGTLSGDVASLSISINDAGSVIGASIDASGNPRAFLWEKGVMTDLNTLIAGDSRLHLLTGCSINSRGEITGLGLTSTGEIHTYLATPTHGVATGESTSQGVISPRALSDDARKLLQQQLRFGRSGARLMGRNDHQQDTNRQCRTGPEKPRNVSRDQESRKISCSLFFLLSLRVRSSGRTTTTRHSRSAART